MYTVASGVAVAKYFDGTSLNNQEISIILGSKFLKLIRNSQRHLAFTKAASTTKRSPIIEAVTTANLGPFKPSGSPTCHSCAVDTSSSFLLDSKAKYRID